MTSATNDNERLALAVRDLVLAVEHYRVSFAGSRLELGTTEVVALGHLYVDGPLTAAQLAGELAITSASATELVDRLEHSGYARRGPHPSDRRKRLVTLTSRGQQTLNDLYGRLGAELSPVYAGLSAEQQQGIDRFLAVASTRIAAITIDPDGA